MPLMPFSTNFAFKFLKKMTATATAPAPQKERLFSVADYLKTEAETGERHVFKNGKIIKMAGGTLPHNRISRNIVQHIGNLVDQKPGFEVLGSDQKIWLEKYNFYVYPDAVVVAEKPILADGPANAIINPLLIVEVLSPSTENYDRHQKFLEYRSLPSFKEYVLIRQDAPEVLVFYKEKPATWVETEVEGLESEVFFQSIQFSLKLALIYRNIEF